MNQIQELLLLQIEDYKNELSVIEKRMVKKVRAGECFKDELRKAKFIKVQIEEAFLMVAERGD